MTSAATPAPYVVPSASAVVVTDRRQVAGRHAQRVVADAAMARWQQAPWPEGCLSVACFLSTDGRIVLFYAPWSDEQHYRRHAASAAAPDAAGRGADLDVDGERLDIIVSRLADPPADRAADGPFPGCVALMTIATDGPERQREAAERIGAFAGAPQPGAIGGHLLFSLDGSRVNLYAEWTSEEAHREAVASAEYGGQGGIFDGVPGIQGLTMHRYQLYRSITR